MMSEIDRRLSDFCRARGIPGIILRRRSNLAWAADGADVHCDTATSLGVAALLWSPARKACLTDTIESPRLRAEEPFERQDWAVEALDWWEADRRIADALAAGYACDFPDDPLHDARATLTADQQARARGLGRDTAEVVERIPARTASPA